MTEKYEHDPVIGVMPILTFWDKNVYFGHQELMTKDWCDKRRGDIGLIGMGGIEEHETVIEALKRELKLEGGLVENDYVIDPEPYGFFNTKKGWVAVHIVFINLGKVNGRTLGPQDGETNCPSRFKSRQLRNFGVRGGVEEVIEAFEEGRRGFELSCVGHHAEANGRIPMNMLYVIEEDNVREYGLIWERVSL